MRASIFKGVARLGSLTSEGCVVQKSVVGVSSIKSRPVQSSCQKFPSLYQSAAIAPGLGAGQRAQVHDPFQLTEQELGTMVSDIHRELDGDILQDSDMREMSKYYFDGKGKAIRPVIALCLGHAFNHHTGASSDSEVIKNQRRVAIISEMIHTASLVHDDVVDHAETRRGKVSVNMKWNPQKSTMCGNYIVGVCSKIMAQIGNPRVIMVLSQVLADLVNGEFQQMAQAKEDESERFETYLSKSFNKTGSLMTYSCEACAILSGATDQEVQAAYDYGRNIGVAFQLVDDLLDFVSSADQLGKPAAADMKLGLATAPVLFATKKHPHLNDLIARRFSQPGDVEEGFKLVIESGGIEDTKALARKYCQDATSALDLIQDSKYKNALVSLCDKVLNRLN